MCDWLQYVLLFFAFLGGNVSSYAVRMSRTSRRSLIAYGVASTFSIAAMVFSSFICGSGRVVTGLILWFVGMVCLVVSTAVLYRTRETDLERSDVSGG